MILLTPLLERYWIEMHLWLLSVESIVMDSQGVLVVMSLNFDDALSNKLRPLGMFTVVGTTTELPRPRIGSILMYGAVAALGYCVGR